MLVMYLRSSSIGDLAMCAQKYYFKYVLGWEDKQNKKAILGSCVHKSLETLANINLAKKNKKRKIKDEIFNHTLKQLEDIELINDLSFDYHVKGYEYLGFTDKDKETTLKWTIKAMEFNGGMYNPLNQDIYIAEKFFDFEIDKSWAEYEYEVNGQVLKGKLRIRGTIDLLLNEAENYYQLLDYKSGKRLNWATGKVKEAEDFQNDHQLLLYYYAMKTIMPESNFTAAIYFINDGGVFPVVFKEGDYQRAEDMLREKFEIIKSTTLPEQISSDQSHWKCQKLCKFSEMYKDTGKTTCQFIHDEIKAKGIDAVTAEHADLSAMNKYSGGGATKELSEEIT